MPPFSGNGATSFSSFLGIRAIRELTWLSLLACLCFASNAFASETSQPIPAASVNEGLMFDLLDLPEQENDGQQTSLGTSTASEPEDEGEGAPSAAERRVRIAGEDEPLNQSAEQVFDFRMQGIGEEVNELKEQVARTKARLQILADTILGGSGVRSGAKLVIEHKNRLGSAYRLIGIQYFLDGAPAFLQADESGALQASRELKIFEQRLVPGEHQLVVRYTLRGSGHGLLSYLDNYTIELTASHDFSVEAGTVTSLEVGLKERRGLTLRFEERPDVVFETHVETDLYRHRPDQEHVRAEGVRQ